MKPNSVLVVNEIFKSMQGEGPSAGRPAMFLRLGGCNLKCVWCDTPYTWDWTRFKPGDELHPKPVQRVYDELVSWAHPTLDMILVVTGGEPLLQQGQLSALLGMVKGMTGWRVEVETAGTIAPAWPLGPRLVDFYNVSPKLEHSGNPAQKRYNPAVIDQFAELGYQGRACFKFVVKAPGDFAEVDRIVQEHNLRPVYIMPEGTSYPTLLARQEDIIQAIIDRGYRLSPRLQIEIWGNRRGV